MNKGRNTAILRRIIGQSAMLIGISLVAGVLTLDRAKLPADSIQALSTSEKEIFSVSLEQVRDVYDGGTVICIDARSTAEFEKGHIPGSISLPFSDFDQALAGNLELFFQNKPIIIYCGGEGCDLSHLLARKLMKIGLDQVSVFTEGWSGWKNAKLPIES